jgi:Na+/H+ antiporter NhaD/arsenite permease-like protein
MVLLMQRAVPEDQEFRRLLGAVVVVAANAGGAWTPIGDVTTTVSNSTCSSAWWLHIAGSSLCAGPHVCGSAQHAMP